MKTQDMRAIYEKRLTDEDVKDDPEVIAAEREKQEAVEYAAPFQAERNRLCSVADELADFACKADFKANSINLAAIAAQDAKRGDMTFSGYLKARRDREDLLLRAQAAQIAAKQMKQDFETIHVQGHSRINDAILKIKHARIAAKKRKAAAATHAEMLQHLHA